MLAITAVTASIANLLWTPGAESCLSSHVRQRADGGHGSKEQTGRSAPKHRFRGRSPGFGDPRWVFEGRSRINRSPSTADYSSNLDSTGRDVAVSPDFAMRSHHLLAPFGSIIFCPFPSPRLWVWAEPCPRIPRNSVLGGRRSPRV